jgi:hypothetical protein
MDTAEVEALRERLEALVRERWGVYDPDVQVSSTLRSDRKIDMRVVSHLFEGKDGLERESLFYPVFDPVPKTDMLHMTYCLLLTPQEAARNFATPVSRTGENNLDTWA